MGWIVLLAVALVAGCGPAVVAHGGSSDGGWTSPGTTESVGTAGPATPGNATSTATATSTLRRLWCERRRAIDDESSRS